MTSWILQKTRCRATALLAGLVIGAIAHVLVCLSHAAAAQELDRPGASERVEPPYQLGERLESGTWELVNLDGRLSGYAFETVPLAPLPGFSGAPINLFVSVTLEGKFIDAEIISHNEPIFVSGLGNAPFHKFVRQYKGYSITDTLVVGVPYGDKGTGSSLIYLDGVTKATASIRIAHETILAAAFAVARKRLSGIKAGPAVRPDRGHSEELTWAGLVSSGIAGRRLVTNAEVDSAFRETLWADDDPLAKDDPQAAYLDLWVVDIGHPSVARAVLTRDSFEELQNFQEISTHDEPILVIDAGRHGLVDKDFVRNTSPDLIFARQDGLPIALRDADLEVELAEGVPGNTAMILRTDRRIGFDPTRPWQLSIRAVRKHGTFMPEVGTVDFSLEHVTPARFYVSTLPSAPAPPWLQAMLDRRIDLAALGLGLLALFGVMVTRLRWLAGLPQFTAVRLAILAVVIGFVGWWGQGQLSIATVLGVIRGIADGQSLAFLLYDPFSLAIWGVTIISFLTWGRGLFCGWLCPFGAMQEFAHHAGRKLGLRQIIVPDRADIWLMRLKYLVLVAMIMAAFVAPALNDQLIEIEPFKTAVTTFFVREWYYVAYAIGLLLLGMVLFKGFCRYLCPLGAFMALGGILRVNDWIPRRSECGSPCQLCTVRCNYNAITKTGAIRYDECFQCLDCVTIHDSSEQCVPLVLAAKGRAL
ncbi:MAG: 4Fe-4S binding protein [Pseudomonadota bacterium]